VRGIAGHAIDTWHGRDQSRGVRMGRRSGDPLGLVDLDDPSLVHHRDAVGQVSDDGNVVRD